MPEKLGLTSFEVEGLGRIAVRLGARSMHLAQAVAETVGRALPEGPHEVAAELPMPLWQGPGQWLLLTRQGETTHVHNELRSIVGGSTALALDLSDAWTTFELVGMQAMEVLETGCALPRSAREARAPYALPIGFCSIPILLQRHDAQRWWLHVDRSLAAALGSWLNDAVQARQPATHPRGAGRSIFLAFRS
jgi:heterotetrameric sarcosine oxidase gamma subunit